MSTRPPLRVGLLLPCRNEAAVIERRLRNLAQLELPEGRHRLLVIDDHSSDATGARARQILAELEPRDPEGGVLEAEVLENDVRPGKNGALEAGLARLADSVDLIVLTDADVLVEPQALRATCAAFAEDQQLGMACASQRFVAALGDDGSCSAPGGAALEPADEVWDRWTAAVRRLESRRGKLFSVHGQWLAWRAELGLVPTGGVAADDVDLMLQVRAGPRPRVRMLSGARFYECKPPAGAAARAQGLRRARAWFQVFGRRGAPVGLTGLDRLQWWCYAHLPGHLPWLVAGAVLVVGTLAAWTWGAGGALTVAALLALLCATPPGREWLRTLGLILRARRLERTGAMPEAWEMSRE